MIQYFQLTPEILLEYIYEGDPKLNVDGVNTKDLCDVDTSTMLLTSNVFATKYLCFKNKYEGVDSLDNLVLPLNNTETQFVVAKSKHHKFYNKSNATNMFFTNGSSKYIYEDTNYDKDILKEEDCDVKYDRCIIHFTNRNYFGRYDGLIFQAYVFMENKAKLYLASFLFKKTSNLELKSEHMLYNEKLYTTHVEFDIPSVYAISTEDNKVFNDALKKQNVNLLKNTPIGINVYGVSGSTLGTDNYIRLKTLKLNTISIPYIYNRLDRISVNINEASDGDYYNIYLEMKSKDMSFVDYIESMGEEIKSYMIMHELCLRESWVDNDGVTHSEITHREHHIIDVNEDDDDYDILKKFDAKIKYRPICIGGGMDYTAIIIDTVKILNIVDSSSYDITGSIEIDNPYKYGKRLKRIEMKKDSRPVVNVYNKKVSDENTGQNILGLNRSGGFVVENMTQNITSFLESTNIGVSIVELSPDDIN